MAGGAEKVAKVRSVTSKGRTACTTAPISAPAAGLLFICRITQGRAGVASTSIGPAGRRLWLGCVHTPLLDGRLFGWVDANRLAHVGLQNRLDKRDVWHPTGTLWFAGPWRVARRQQIHYIFNTYLPSILLV